MTAKQPLWCPTCKVWFDANRWLDKKCPACHTRGSEKAER